MTGTFGSERRTPRGAREPVADVASVTSPIAERTFSDDPESAAEMTAAFVRGCEREKLACAPSHFPGLGAATQDTDVGPASVGLDQATLESRDLVPFVAAFRAGENGVVVPQVDYPGDRFVFRTVDFGPLAALIVEGTYVLGLADLDACVFCAATHEQTAERRRLRNRDVDAPIIDEILALEHRLITPQAALADLIVDCDYRVVARVGSSPP